MSVLSLQDQFASGNHCFGCGPSNERGLRLKSFPEADGLVARFTPESHHQAFEGILNGGIIGTLLDCHCNWTAAWHLMNRDAADRPPCTVTAEYKIELRAPTPIDRTVELRSWVEQARGSRATIVGELTAGSEVTAVCRGIFVAVRPGHPAYHGWA